MTENMPVRCPVCRREHPYAPPVYPCACGAPVTPPIDVGGVPERIQHRTWAECWVTVRCESCGSRQDWPRPELGCDCGALLWLPVADDPIGFPADLRVDVWADSPEATPNGTGRPRGVAERPVKRPAFRPVTIRTARDAVLAARQYLQWLGFTRLRAAESRTITGIDLRGADVVARVDPTTTPTGLRDIETLWLNGLNESAVPVCFSLAGYARDARSRADELNLPLFVLDLTGTPQPVNDAADELINC